MDGQIGTGVLIGDKANLESLSQITVEAWVNNTDPSADGAIDSKHSSANPSWVLRTVFSDNTAE